jgi:lysophospholipase L1-like esterase
MSTVVALSVFLSLLPLPDNYRPFPELTKHPGTTLVAALWPKKAHNNAQPVVELPPEPDKALVLPEFDFSVAGGSKVSRGLSYEDEREAQRWEAMIKKVQAAHVDIEEPCLEQTRDGSCARTALEPFFRALREAREATATRPVRVVTLGTSLIASDHITDVARRRLQTRHGSGGTGYMYVDRPTRGAGRDVRCGKATEGWGIDKLTDEKFSSVLGMAGVAFNAAANDPQQVTFGVVGQRLAELFLVTQPNGGDLEVKADGTLVAEISTAGDAVRPATSLLEIPEGAKLLQVRSKNGPVRLDGVSLENGLPGVVFDSLGLPGGAAYVFLRANEDMFASQLIERRPALVILMMGGNEAFDLSLNRYTMADAKRNMEKLIDRVKAIVPNAACLLESPPDAGLRRMDQTINARKETALVSAYMHDVAFKKGCAIWDMQAAMGGEGAISRWWDAGLMNADLVHPIGVGGDVFGYLMDTAIERARQKSEARLAARVQHRFHATEQRAWSSPQLNRIAAGAGADGGEDAGELVPATGGTLGADAGTGVTTDGGAKLAHTRDAGMPELQRKYPIGPGLTNPDGLTRFFERLRHLELENSGRVAILQIGASHTAAQHFTDTARSILADRFGYAGRGFVAAGKAQERLLRSGVERDLTGYWQLPDAMKVKTPGERWGLTGVRAVGHPGSSAMFEFVEPHSAAEDSARVQVFVLEEPGMGPMQIRLDDREGYTLMAPKDGVTKVRVLEMGASGSHHTVKVENPGPGDITLLGVAHELVRPGIVYDALGLPGSTAVTFSNYDSDTLVSQLKARQPDLFVLFYGTNESALPQDKLEDVRAAYPKIIANLRQAAPDAACLFLGPTDRMTKKKASVKWIETKSIDEVYDLEREVAFHNGCAFWETREAMGGEGSIEKWRKYKPPLANKDHVHLTQEGYRLLASEMVKDLLEAYDEWAKKAAAQGDSP